MSYSQPFYHSLPCLYSQIQTQNHRHHECQENQLLAVIFCQWKIGLLKMQFKLCYRLFSNNNSGMSGKKRVGRPEMVEMLEQFQAQELKQLADSQISHLCTSKEREASMNKHDQSSQYFDSNLRNEVEGDKDALLNEINQMRPANGFKGIFDVIEQRATGSRSKALLFKRWKNEQREEIAMTIKEIEALRIKEQEQNGIKCSYGNLADQRRQFQRDSMQKRGKKEIFIKSSHHKMEKLEFTQQDLQKLTPNQDLNDTIIENYLKIVKTFLVSQQMSHRVHFFSTFFFHKLISDNFQYIFGDQVIANKLPKQYIKEIRQATEKNYCKVKRWTKGTDIFEKDILVFPINAFSHWFCVIVLNPHKIWSNQGMCQFIYCDSLFQSKDVIFEPLKEYLRLQLRQKKNKTLNRSEQRVTAYQLLLPKQTNTHDCGLYMLAYIDELLSQPLHRLSQLKIVSNRNQLGLFPRMLIFTMRDRLLRLIDELSSPSGQERMRQICHRFVQEKRAIMSSSNERIGYQQINEYQFQKYKAMFLCKIDDDYQSLEEQDFHKRIMFYLDAQINYFEKNTNQ